jgi:aerobic carbon-monoxide dehydrogenase small subunit
MSVQCRFQVNGMAVEVDVQPGARLLDVLRGPLALPGTKEGCGNGECGACTVIVDGRAVNACLFPALEADGTTITTIEGLAAPGGKLSPVQRAFVTEGGVQCGFCTPGMVMSVTALLARTTSPTDDEIRDALVGNLCRCTGYKQIVDAIHTAAAAMRAGES